MTEISKQSIEKLIRYCKKMADESENGAIIARDRWDYPEDGSDFTERIVEHFQWGYESGKFDSYKEMAKLLEKVLNGKEPTTSLKGCSCKSPVRKTAKRSTTRRTIARKPAVRRTVRR